MSEEGSEDFSRLMDELTPIVAQDFDGDTPQHVHPMAGADQVQPAKEEATNALASLDHMFCAEFAVFIKSSLSCDHFQWIHLLTVSTPTGASLRLAMEHILILSQKLKGYYSRKG